MLSPRTRSSTRFSRSRVVLKALMVTLGAGTISCVPIPKAAKPEGPLPLVYVSTVPVGIMVNNNIVQTDTYDDLERAGRAPRKTALRTGAQRLRPVVPTSVATALGLILSDRERVVALL